MDISELSHEAYENPHFDQQYGHEDLDDAFANDAYLDAEAARAEMEQYRDAMIEGVDWSETVPCTDWPAPPYEPFDEIPF